MRRPAKILLEAARHDFFRKWYDLVHNDIIIREGFVKQGYPDHQIWEGPVICKKGSNCRELPDKEFDKIFKPEKNELRLIFIGTSQTIGCGAGALENTFFARTHQALTKTFAPALNIRSLNISASASNSTRLLKACLSFALGLIWACGPNKFADRPQVHPLRNGL